MDSFQSRFSCRGSSRHHFLLFVIIAVAELGKNPARSNISCYRCSWAYPVYWGLLDLEMNGDHPCLPPNFHSGKVANETCIYGCITLATFNVLDNNISYPAKVTEHYNGTFQNILMSNLRNKRLNKIVNLTFFYRGCSQEPSVQHHSTCEALKTSVGGGKHAVQLKCHCFSELCNGESQQKIVGSFLSIIFRGWLTIILVVFFAYYFLD